MLGDPPNMKNYRATPVLPTRAIIVGFGSIGRRHLNILRDVMPSLDIRVMSRKSVVSAPPASNGFFSSIDDARDFKPNIAIICSPASKHVEHAVCLCKVGAHLLIEKPVSDSLCNIEELVSETGRRHLKPRIAYNLRFNQSLRYFRQQIKSGSIGRVLSVHAEVGQFLPDWRPGTNYVESVSANKSLGGGVLLELSHELDYIRWVFGEVHSVSAKLGQLSTLELDVEDHANLTLQIKKGDKKQVLAYVNMDFFRRDKKRTCIAVGEYGSIEWNANKGRVRIWSQNMSDWDVVYEDQTALSESYVTQMKSFLGLCPSDSNTYATLCDGIDVLKIVEAARISNSNGSAFVKIKDRS